VLYVGNVVVGVLYVGNGVVVVVVVGTGVVLVVVVVVGAGVIVVLVCGARYAGITKFVPRTLNHVLGVVNVKVLKPITSAANSTPMTSRR
jgi:hypothetical protein